jgi:hypothetical protein
MGFFSVNKDLPPIRKPTNMETVMRIAERFSVFDLSAWAVAGDIR